MFDRLAATIPGVSAISVTSGVCPEQVCSPLVNRIFLRWDGVHFTAEGAQLMVPTLEAQLKTIAGW
jgi:lysophospholipase L1-like esterase